MSKIYAWVDSGLNDSQGREICETCKCAALLHNQQYCDPSSGTWYYLCPGKPYPKPRYEKPLTDKKNSINYTP